LFQQPNSIGREISQLVRLQPIGQYCNQQMPGQMEGWVSSKHAFPARLQSFEIEIAQMRDLVV
jgi:hypothetical protein